MGEESRRARGRTGTVASASPVLFLVFNRPETTGLVFEAIRRARPRRLYVAADGPRDGRKGEAERCASVRQVATAVDWPCEVHTLFQDENLGCRVAVSTALDWFFEHEPEGIILEDDCLPDASFFEYCSVLLERFRDDERVMTISGNHFHGPAHMPDYSYFFSRYPHIWGWATWRRAWQHYDRNLVAWPDLRGSGWLATIGDGRQDFVDYWTRIFDLSSAGGVDSWAYRWTFSCWLRDALTALPARNVVKNIGFGPEATHTTMGGGLAALPLESLDLPLEHPPAIVRDREADRWTDITVFGTYRPLRRRAASWLVVCLKRHRTAIGVTEGAPWRRRRRS